MKPIGVPALLAACLLCVATVTAARQSTVTSAHPPNTINHPEISARCKHSGICSHTPTQADCRRHPPSHHTAGPDSAALAAARDEQLACTFDAEERAERVKEAGRWTWKGYRDCAWGWDEVQPLSCTGAKWFNLSLNAVDGMDTLYLMGLDKEFDEAIHLAMTVDPNINQDVNLFESTIRIVGGLLSTYRLIHTTQPVRARKLLDLAIEVGSRLSHGFESPSGIPYTDVVLKTGKAYNPSHASYSSTSEISTLSLEFATLARYTNHSNFETLAMTVHNILTKTIDKTDGLLPQYFNPHDGEPSGNYIMLGARSDSYYEYLLKHWILTGKTNDLLLKRYIGAMQSVRKRLLNWTGADNSGLLYVAEDVGGTLSPKMDHLVCFLPGLLALGDFHGVDTRLDENDMTDLEVAAHLTQSCYEMYRRSPAGLAPEIVFFTERKQPSKFFNFGWKPKQQQQQQQQQEDRVTAGLSVLQQKQRQQKQQLRRGGRQLNNQQQQEPTLNDDSNNGNNNAPIDKLEITQEEEGHRVEAESVGGGDFMIKDMDSHNLLRPETVESIYIMWKVTGDPMYRDWAWLIFRAFEKWTKLQGIEQCRAADPLAASAEVVWTASMSAAKATATSLLSGHGIDDALKEAQSNVERLISENLIGHSQPMVQGEGSEAFAAAVLAFTKTAAYAAAAATAEALEDPSSHTATTNSAGGGMNGKGNRDHASVGRPFFGGCTEESRGGGYTNLGSVLSTPAPRRDKTESFWLAETLKYLYLIFVESPDRCLHDYCSTNNPPTGHTIIPLDKFVFNTEAHPLAVIGPPEDSILLPVEFTHSALHVVYETPEAAVEEHGTDDDGQQQHWEEHEAEHYIGGNDGNNDEVENEIHQQHWQADQEKETPDIDSVKSSGSGVKYERAGGEDFVIEPKFSDPRGGVGDVIMAAMKRHANRQMENPLHVDGGDFHQELPGHHIGNGGEAVIVHGGLHEMREAHGEGFGEL